jgi:hypothetical protein
VFPLNNPGRVFRRDELMRKVWAHDFGGASTVTVHVRRLREKIEDDPSHPKILVTLRGVGYRFDPPAASGGPVTGDTGDGVTAARRARDPGRADGAINGSGSGLGQQRASGGVRHRQGRQHATGLPGNSCWRSLVRLGGWSRRRPRPTRARNLALSRCLAAAWTKPSNCPKWMTDDSGPDRRFLGCRVFLTSMES